VGWGARTNYHQRIEARRRGAANMQNHRDLVTAVKDHFEATGVPLAGACGAFRICNEVARILNTGGVPDSDGRLPWGLLKKAGGHRAVPSESGCQDGDATSAPGYATDYLIARDTWFGFDILGDSGGANEPQWPDTPETTFVDRNRENFANPIGTIVIVPPVVVDPGPGPIVVVPPPTSVDLAQVLTRLDALGAQLVSLENLVKQHEDMNALRHSDVAAHFDELKRYPVQFTGTLTLFGVRGQVTLDRVLGRPPA
jgi:hypothetical protein